MLYYGLSVVTKRCVCIYSDVSPVLNKISMKAEILSVSCYVLKA